MTRESGPKMPETPSRTINKMLQDKCGKQHDNVVKNALAYYICGFFQVITTFYKAVNPNPNTHSHKVWMIACAFISLLVVLKAYLVYNIILASAFVMHILLKYGAMAMGLFGVGLGVSGAVFFDKDGGKESVKRSYSAPKSAPPPPPESAKVVPQMVKEIETGKVHPAPETSEVTPSAPPPSSGTHGSPAEPEKTEEEKKDI